MRQPLTLFVGEWVLVGYAMFINFQKCRKRIDPVICVTEALNDVEGTTFHLQRPSSTRKDPATAGRKGSPNVRTWGNWENTENYVNPLRSLYYVCRRNLHQSV